MVKFEIFATAYIIGGSLVVYQIDPGSNPGTVKSVSFTTENIKFFKFELFNIIVIICDIHFKSVVHIFKV